MWGDRAAAEKCRQRAACSLEMLWCPPNSFSVHQIWGDGALLHIPTASQGLYPRGHWHALLPVAIVAGVSESPGANNSHKVTSVAPPAGVAATWCRWALPTPTPKNHAECSLCAALHSSPRILHHPRRCLWYHLSRPCLVSPQDCDPLKDSEYI